MPIKEQYWRNPEKYRKKAIDWQKQNRERSRKTKREWKQRDRKKNPEKYRIIQKNHREQRRVAQLRRRKEPPEKGRIYHLIHRHPERYPLDDKCAFCEVVENLVHGHLDYEDDGFNYLTVCHQCNMWMEKK